MNAQPVFVELSDAPAGRRRGLVRPPAVAAGRPDLRDKRRPAARSPWRGLREVDAGEGAGRGGAADAGSFRGRDLWAMPPAERRRAIGGSTGMIFQDPSTALNRRLTRYRQSPRDPLDVHGFRRAA
ncbi:hypothetical protein SVIOM74S_08114 [Streptomyces violarus]